MSETSTTAQTPFLRQRLYVAQFVMVYEDQWFAFGIDSPPIRSEKCYGVVSQLYAACDAEDAYRLAVSWLPGMGDSNHDGAGDLFLMSSTGLHEIEEVTPLIDDLHAALRIDSGVEVGHYDPRDIDAGGVPTVRSNDELGIFRHYNTSLPEFSSGGDP